MDIPSLLPQTTTFPNTIPCLMPELPALWHSWHMPDVTLLHSSHDLWPRVRSNQEVFCEKATRLNVGQAELHCCKYQEVKQGKQYERENISSGVGVSSYERVKFRHTSSRHKYMKAQEATKVYRRRSRSLPSETDILDLFHEDDKNHKIEQVVPVTQMETQLPETRVSHDLLSEAMSKTTDEGYNSYKQAFRSKREQIVSPPEQGQRPVHVIKPPKPPSLKGSTSLPTDQELIKNQDHPVISSISDADPSKSQTEDHNEQLLNDYLSKWKEDFELNREMIDLNPRNSASDGIDFSDSCSDSDSTLSSVVGESSVKTNSSKGRKSLYKIILNSLNTIMPPKCYGALAVLKYCNIENVNV